MGILVKLPYMVMMAFKSSWGFKSSTEYCMCSQGAPVESSKQIQLNYVYIQLTAEITV